MRYLYSLFLNPEPWAVGSVSAGRRNGKIRGSISPNPNLVAYQEAVREELEEEQMLPSGSYKIQFYFWRQQAQYLDAADRKRQRNQADATNLQKGLEDALQGVLFENDRDVLDIRSVICEQGPHVNPRIGIIIEVLSPNLHDLTVPRDLMEHMVSLDAMPEPTAAKNVWPPPGRF